MKPAEAAGIDVLWTPSEIDAVRLEGRPAAVIDVVRATTTILVALEAGAREVVPAASEEEARRIAAGEEDTLLCGERGGRRIRGFDLGNSPGEYTPDRVGGRRLAFRTSNGTGAIRAAAGAGWVGLASFRNLDAMARRLRREEGAPILLCAGRDGRMGWDDVLCAGMLVERLLPDGAERGALRDGARAALELCAAAGSPDAALLEATDAGAAVARIGLGADLEVCADVNASERVPVLVEGRLVLDHGGDHGD